MQPLLLDGFKLDLRVYVLITSCNPLRIFVYKDGLVRLSTQLYTTPTDENIVGLGTVNVYITGQSNYLLEVHT